MRRTLVVANRTLGGEHLAAEISARLRDGPTSFFILVPASHDHMVWTEGEAAVEARSRLESALTDFRHLGATVDGAVGDANPLLAIADALRDDEFDDILLSTLPPGPSRWLKQDLPHRVERRFGLPVTHIVATPEHAGL